jgi:hypothetical protein
MILCLLEIREFSVCAHSKGLSGRYIGILGCIMSGVRLSAFILWKSYQWKDHQGLPVSRLEAGWIPRGTIEAGMHIFYKTSSQET